MNLHAKDPSPPAPLPSDASDGRGWPQGRAFAAPKRLRPRRRVSVFGFPLSAFRFFRFPLVPPCYSGGGPLETCRSKFMGWGVPAEQTLQGKTNSNGR